MSSIFNLPVSSIGDIVRGKFIRFHHESYIQHILIDSRKIFSPDATVYFAIRGQRHNGHDYIVDLYAKGLRNFIVDQDINIKYLPEANVLLVNNSIDALQHLAVHRRKFFNISVVGITGSNAKTIVKEWASQLLSEDYSVVKNPGSYNSQIGVPLSVWQINQEHELGIFEAGISKPGEMIRLKEIIQPEIGIFTNIGTSHDEGFSSQEEKIYEKLKLFQECKTLIYCADHISIHDAVQKTKLNTLSWGYIKAADIILSTENNRDFKLTYRSKQFQIHIPLSEKAQQENCFHCICLLLLLGKTENQINKRIKTLTAIPMRLELKKGIANTYLIDDTYNNDLAGLQIALDFQGSFPQENKWLILSDILQTGMEDKTLYTKVNALIKNAGINRLIAVGKALTSCQNIIETETLFYPDTESLIKDLYKIKFNNELILIKGARPFRFENVVKRLIQKKHSTILEINLSAVLHNFNFIKSKLKKKVKTMAMVKAFAYGSGIEEIASILQYHKVDYLGVAYADEGVKLRAHDITVPIMVMNVNEESFELCFEQNLEPEIYSVNMLQKFIEASNYRTCGIHLKIETGMNRLGIAEDEIDAAFDLLLLHPHIKVNSVLTHLAASENSQFDLFTHSQVERFENIYDKISQVLKYNPLRHVLNSSGIIRFPDYQFDMVRIGIALYGVDPTRNTNELQPALSLKSTISQIKKIKKGESVGYGRNFLAEKDSTIATIAIGYADGLRRSVGNEKGSVLINGLFAPIVGNVCMDMCMVQLEGVDAAEGDEVIIFGTGLPLEQHAAWANTITYEIISGISERVKRVFTSESF
jgi:Alr-MurF fusion protein